MLLGWVTLGERASHTADQRARIFIFLNATNEFHVIHSPSATTRNDLGNRRTDAVLGLGRADCALGLWGRPVAAEQAVSQARDRSAVGFQRAIGSWRAFCVQGLRRTYVGAGCLARGGPLYGSGADRSPSEGARRHAVSGSRPKIRDAWQRIAAPPRCWNLSHQVLRERRGCAESSNGEQFQLCSRSCRGIRAVVRGLLGELGPPLASRSSKLAGRAPYRKC